MSSAPQPSSEPQSTPNPAAPAKGRGMGAMIAGSIALTLTVGVAIGVSVAVLAHESKGTAPAALATGVSATASEPESANPGVPMTSCSWTAARNRSTGQVSPGIPPKRVPAAGSQTMQINTNRGSLALRLDLAKTPCTAASFAHLATKKYFDNTKCHRLTTNGIYVLQCGDPTGTGMGNPGYAFADEALGTGESMTYKAGTVAMANSGPNTNGSQFFIVYRDSVLAPSYTVLGELTQGLDLVNAVASAGVDPNTSGGQPDGTPASETVISSLTITS